MHKLKIILLYLSITKSSFSQESFNRPQGIFIQVSTASTWVLPYLDQWLQTICARNTQLQPHQRMNDIVLVDVASEAAYPTNFTMRFDVLDIIVPYLPGGSKQCFGNVFLGSVYLEWKGEGDAYSTGIQDAAFRQRNVDLSKQVALEFARKYPQLKVINWYVTYEANLNYLTDTNVAAAYQKYLTDLIQSLVSVKSDSVMWSPAFWKTYSSLIAEEISTLKTNLGSLFTEVQRNAEPGVNWMNLQDSIGKASNPNCTGVTSTPMDAVNLFRLVQSSFPFVSMQMNSELFEFDSKCSIGRSPPTNQIEKENFYAAHGIPMGAAFEIRYWREV